MTEGKYNIEITYGQVCRIFRMKSCNVLMYAKEKGIPVTYRPNEVIINQGDFPRRDWKPRGLIRIMYLFP